MSFKVRLFYVDNSASSGGTGDVIRSKEKATGIKSQVIVVDKGGSGAEDLSPLEGADITTPTAMPTGGVGIRGWLSSIWTKLNGTLAVTGTFFQASQPVSIAATVLTDPSDRAARLLGIMTNVNLDVLLSTRLKPADTLAAISLISDIRQAVAANLQMTATPIAIVKGTQGGTGFTTQDLKDAGRVMVSISATQVTGVTAEALISLTPYRDLVAGTAATTFTVTAGKRLRIQSMTVTWRNTTAAAGGVTVRLRFLAGAVLVTSPVYASLNASTGLATIGSGTSSFEDFPDGLELSGTMQLGITQIAVGAVSGFDINLIGYEY